MSAPPPEPEQSDLMLAEAAQSDLLLMRHVQSLVLASDDAQEVGTLVHAYARASRAMRQNIALLARQKADRVKAAREAAQHEAWLRARDLGSERSLQDFAYDERGEELHDAVGRVISAAAADDRARHADLAHRFDRELDDWVEADDFLDEDLDAHVLRACRVLGLPDDLSARWRDLPKPTYFPDPEPQAAEPRPAVAQPPSGSGPSAVAPTDADAAPLP